MHRFLILTVLFAGAALVTPVAMRAEDHHDKRYYDKDHCDYHTWNDHEDRAYRIYLGEQHRDYRDFASVNVEQRRDYFREGTSLAFPDSLARFVRWGRTASSGMTSHGRQYRSLALAGKAEYIRP